MFFRVFADIGLNFFIQASVGRSVKLTPYRDRIFLGDVLSVIGDCIAVQWHMTVRENSVFIFLGAMAAIKIFECHVDDFLRMTKRDLIVKHLRHIIHEALAQFSVVFIKIKRGGT